MKGCDIIALKDLTTKIINHDKWWNGDDANASNIKFLRDIDLIDYKDHTGTLYKNISL